MFRKKNLATFQVSPKAAEKMRSVSRASRVPIISSGKTSTGKGASATVVSIQKVTASGKSIFQFARAHSLFLGFIVLLLIGMIVGTIVAKNADDSLLTQLDFLFASNFQSRIQQPAGSTFVASLASSFIFLLVIFLAGNSLWGGLLIPFIVFFRGFGLGILTGYLYYSYGWYGFLFHLLVILPGMFLSSIGISYGSEKSFKLSIRLLGAQKKAADRTSEINFKQYFFLMGKACTMITFAALLDMVCMVCFSGLFQL